MDIKSLDEMSKEAEIRILNVREKLQQLEKQTLDFSQNLDNLVISRIERYLSMDRALLEINALNEITEEIERKLEESRLIEAETTYSKDRDKLRKRWERTLEKVNAATSPHEEAETLVKLAAVSQERRRVS